MLLYVADAFDDSSDGGAEQNDAVLLSRLNRQVPLLQRRSQDVEPSWLKPWLANSDNHVLLGNCSDLQQDAITYLERHQGRYSLIEHDHHYLTTRNPRLYPNYIAPESERANQRLFQRAHRVFCQSNHQQRCLQANSDQVNAVNLGCNFWSQRWLKTLKLLRQNPERQHRYAVMDSRAPIKNTSGALAYCNKHDLEVELIPSLPYPLFLQALSRCRGLVFLPQWVESFSRLVMEAALLGLEIHTNQHVGVLHEDWFLQHRQGDGTWSVELFTSLEQRQELAWQRLCRALPGCGP
jgi:hypothetical protein